MTATGRTHAAGDLQVVVVHYRSRDVLPGSRSTAPGGSPTDRCNDFAL
jgi:hypothetical protein